MDLTWDTNLSPTKVEFFSISFFIVLRIVEIFLEFLLTKRLSTVGEVVLIVSLISSVFLILLVLTLGVANDFKTLSLPQIGQLIRP